MTTASATHNPFGSERDAWLTAILWAALAACVRAWWLSRHPAVPAWDGAIYYRTAVRIAHGLGFVDTWNNRPPFKPTAFYPVGYPAVLAAGLAILGNHRWVAGLINVLSGAACTLFCTRFAGTAFGRPAAHAAGALYALAPGAVIYTSAFMTEPLSAALLCAAITAGLRHARTDSAPSALLCGALLGAGALVRPPALLLAPVLAIATAPCFVPKTLLRTLVLVGVACCAVVLPWTARNCHKLDGCALVSVNGGSNLWIGTDPAANGGYRNLRPHEGCDHVHGEVAKDRCYGRLAMLRIKREPGAWLALASLKLVQLLGHETSPVAYLEATDEPRPTRNLRPWFNIMTAYHLCLLGLSLIALAPISTGVATHKPREVWVAVAAIGALLAVHVVFFGVDRYHFVFTPLLCTLAAGTLRRGDVTAGT